MQEIKKYQSILESLTVRRISDKAKKLVKSGECVWQVDTEAPRLTVGLVTVVDGEPTNEAVLVLYVEEEDLEFNHTIFS